MANETTKDPRARPISKHRLARFFPEQPHKAAGPGAMKAWRELQLRAAESAKRFDRLEPKAQDVIEAVLDYGDTAKGHEAACDAAHLGGSEELTGKEKRRCVAHVLGRFDTNRVFIDYLHATKRDRMDPVRFRSIVKGAIEEAPPAADLAQLIRAYKGIENKDGTDMTLDDVFGRIDSLVGSGAVDTDGAVHTKDG